MKKLDFSVVLFEQADWGPRKTPMGHQMTRMVDEVIVHHSYIPSIPCGETIDREIAAMRSMDKFHTVDNAWGGFGYNLAIYNSGHIFEGRGFKRTGAHTEGRNSSTLGVVFVTDGQVHQLSPAAITAFRAAMSLAIREQALSARYTISPHDRYKNKVCPGAKIKAQIPAFLGTVVRTWPTMRLGDRGEVVTYLQRFLIQSGFMAAGHPFGYFGSVTEEAVKRLQKSFGLNPDGIVGPLTWAKIP